MSSETNWYVLTGAAGSGKSSIINELSRRGYATCPEAATLVLNEMNSRGEDVEDFQNTMNFHRRVEKTNRDMESRTPESQHVFMDRSLLDNLAYKEHFQGKSDTYLIDEVEGKYRKIFFLERIPFEKNDREERKESAPFIKDKLWKYYRKAGYEPVKIPLGTVNERTDEILNHINPSRYWQEKN